MSRFILGISAHYHDSAAAILKGREIIAAAQEERFTRRKHDSSFPENAIHFVLSEAGISLNQIAAIAFYEKPFIKFERLLETYHEFAPQGLVSFCTAIPVWIKEKLFMKKMLRDQLSKLDTQIPPLLFPEHHLSHAASAFFPSPFYEAAILTIDGVGEWATATIGQGKGKSITIKRELEFPHSLGLLYTAVTDYCGFRVNSGEYKLMGLAPYGNQGSQQKEMFKQLFLNEIVDIRDDGSILLNMKYFRFATGFTMCHIKKWEALFGIRRRKPESEITQPYMDLALAIQEITEEIILKLAHTAKSLTGSDHLVMAGGVALNCVANGKLLRSGLFKNIWIQPAAGDAGGAIGAAYATWHIKFEQERHLDPEHDSMKGTYLGPEYSDKDILKSANRFNSTFEHFDSYDKLVSTAAELIANGHIVGWFQGRMEFGPRALGNRSILGDARNPDMQKKLNLKIKYRETFRPFAPSVLDENKHDYFELDQSSPYMVLVAPINKDRRNPYPTGFSEMNLSDKLYHIRSDIPAVTHIDYSARIQTVHKETNPKFWKLIDAFKQKTGYSLIVNTSFNIRGEPIVCTPEDAYRCFMRTEMDYLIMGNYVFDKLRQPEFNDDLSLIKTSGLD